MAICSRAGKVAQPAVSISGLGADRERWRARPGSEKSGRPQESTCDLPCKATHAVPIGRGWLGLDGVLPFVRRLLAYQSCPMLENEENESLLKDEQSMLMKLSLEE